MTDKNQTAANTTSEKQAVPSVKVSCLTKRIVWGSAMGYASLP